MHAPAAVRAPTCTQVHEAFAFSKRLRAMLQPLGGDGSSSSSGSRAQLEALLPDALEAGARFLALQGLALQRLQPACLVSAVGGTFCCAVGAGGALYGR